MMFVRLPVASLNQLAAECLKMFGVSVDIAETVLMLSSERTQLMLQNIRLDHHLSVCLSAKCILAKRLSGSGCRLGW